MSLKFVNSCRCNLQKKNSNGLHSSYKIVLIMNWWGHLDTDPNRLHVPWGTTSFQVKATFRQLKALVIECCDRWIPLPCRTEAESKLSRCYNVKYLSSTINNNWWPVSKQEVINSLPEHDIFVFSGHSSFDILQFCSESGNDNCFLTNLEIATYREGKSYKFVLILGCGVGNNIDEWKSSFGTNCIIAFADLLYEDVANAWDWRFWDYVFRPNQTIESAATLALCETYIAFFNFLPPYTGMEPHLVMRGNGKL